jgi:hypothetical protein
VEQAENIVSGTEDRVEVLGQIVKDNKKIWMEHERYLRHHEKTKPTNHGFRRWRGDTN